MHEYLVLLGSNIDVESNIPAAIQMTELHPQLDVVSVSGVFESPALVASGEVDHARCPYHNAAIRLRTQLDSEALRSELRHMEAALERVRGEDKYADRTIDLDIVGVRYEGGQFEIDPIVHEQIFAALPVAEIAPSWPVEVGGPPLRELPGQVLQGETQIRRIQ